jgi:hypothetical protein
MNIYELGVFVLGSPTFMYQLPPNVTFQSPPASCQNDAESNTGQETRCFDMFLAVSHFFQVQYDSTSDETTNASPK